MSGWRVKLGEALLRCFAPPSRTDELVGDLADELDLRRGSGAERWYLSQCVRSTLPLARMRVANREPADRRLALAVFALVTSLLAVVIAAHAIGDLVRSLVPMREGRTPMPAFLVGTLVLASAVVAVSAACGRRFLRVAFSLTSATIAGLAAATFVQAVGVLTVALLPLWYRAAFFVLLPLASAAAVSSTGESRR